MRQRQKTFIANDFDAKIERTKTREWRNYKMRYCRSNAIFSARKQVHDNWNLFSFDSWNFLKIRKLVNRSAHSFHRIIVFLLERINYNTFILQREREWAREQKSTRVTKITSEIIMTWSNFSNWKIRFSYLTLPFWFEFNKRNFNKKVSFSHDFFIFFFFFFKMKRKIVQIFTPKS